MVWSRVMAYSINISIRDLVTLWKSNHIFIKVLLSIRINRIISIWSIKIYLINRYRNRLIINRYRNRYRNSQIVEWDCNHVINVILIYSVSIRMSIEEYLLIFQIMILIRVKRKWIWFRIISLEWDWRIVLKKGIRVIKIYRIYKICWRIDWIIIIIIIIRMYLIEHKDWIIISIWILLETEKIVMRIIRVEIWLINKINWNIN